MVMLSMNVRLLVAIGKLQIVEKCCRWRRTCPDSGAGAARVGVLPLPGLRAGDLQWAGVGNGRRTVGAEELQSCVEVAVGAELGGRKGEVDVVGIGEVDLVVVPAVAVVGEDVAAAGRGGLERMSAEHPIAEVDDVNILLDENVAGEGAIPEPVAQPVLVGRDAGDASSPSMPVRCSCQRRWRSFPSAPALMRSAMAAMGGALRHWKPTSTL